VTKISDKDEYEAASEKQANRGSNQAVPNRARPPQSHRRGQDQQARWRL